MHTSPLLITRSAFTRADLLSLVATAAMLALLVLGSGSATRTATEAAGCQQNSRRLVQAWLAHAMDNRFLLRNNEALARNPAGWAWGWLDWGISTDNTNAASVQTDAFKPYIGSDTGVFRCPSDRFVSPSQRARGWRNRIRSYSMNNNVGILYYNRLSDFTAPSDTFVFLEEHPDSINDTFFATDTAGASNPNAAALVDIPASFHGRGAQFGFADGHVEHRRWTGQIIPQPVKTQQMVLGIQARNDPDAIWLAQHARPSGP